MSPLGSSGGRSRNSRVDPRAKRRAKPRERAKLEPPADELVPAFPGPRERREELALAVVRRVNWDRVGQALAWGSWSFFCVLLAVLVCAWWGLL